MSIEVRMADSRDYRAVIRLRAEWLDRFCANHPGEERWCPAGCRVPDIEDEHLLSDHLPRPERIDPHTLARENACWAAGVLSEGKADAYLLWRANKEKRELAIWKHTPRVSSRVELEEAGGQLVDFVLQHAREQGLKQVSISLHGFPDEVDPLVDLYHAHGFKGELRWEMVSHQLHLDPGPHQLEFRSAEEVGLDSFYEIDAKLRNWPAEDSKKSCAMSQKMWTVEPGTDWLLAYEGRELVGTVQVAVTPTGVGVLDGIAVVPEHRGRGLGRALLARGLSALIGRTDVVWLDVDQDNVSAQQLYQWAGFKLLHRHGVLVAKLPPA